MKLIEEVVRRRLRLLCVTLIMLAGISGWRSPLGAQTSDGSGAYSTESYRNVFAEQGHSASEVKSRIESTYQQLFHGDPQTQAIFYPTGKNANGSLAYITDWANNDVRTEGMSYGMMICPVEP